MGDAMLYLCLSYSSFRFFHHIFSPAPRYMFLLVYITDRILKSMIPLKRLFFGAGVSGEKKNGEYSLHFCFQIIMSNDISMF